MKDEQKASHFRDLINTDSFQAQISLENDTYSSLLSKLITFDMKNADVSLEYARIRGSLETIKLLQATRERLVTESRTRNSNS